MDKLGSPFSMCEYTDEDREDHYRVLENGIKFHTENRPLTEDFLDESKDLLSSFSANFPKLSQANPTVKDYRFRELMVESECLLEHLRREIKESGMLNTRLFYEFCKKQKQCLSILETLDGGMNELTNMVTTLTIKTKSRKLRR